MSSRDVGVLALGRFLAVERYCQSSQPSSPHPVRSPDRRSHRHAAPQEQLPAPARPWRG